MPLFGAASVSASVDQPARSDNKVQRRGGTKYAARASGFANVKRAFPFPSQDPQFRTMARDQSGLANGWIFCGSPTTEAKRDTHTLPANPGTHTQTRLPGLCRPVPQWQFKTRARVRSAECKRRAMQSRWGKGGRGRIKCVRKSTVVVLGELQNHGHAQARPGWVGG